MGSSEILTEKKEKVPGNGEKRRKRRENWTRGVGGGGD
jgi:hypothetical protein